MKATSALKLVLDAGQTVASVPMKATARLVQKDSIFLREDVSKALIHVMKQHPKLSAVYVVREGSRSQVQMSTPATTAPAIVKLALTEKTARPVLMMPMESTTLWQKKATNLLDASRPVLQATQRTSS